MFLQQPPPHEWQTFVKTLRQEIQYWFTADDSPGFKPSGKAQPKEGLREIANDLPDVQP